MGLGTDVLRFKSPGIYIQDKDISGIIIKKNQIRRVNIIKIFKLNIHRDIYATSYGTNHTFKLK